MTIWHTTWNLWKAHPRERVKLALGALFFRKSTQQWLSYLHERPPLWRQLDRFPKLVTRIYRPYALRGLGCIPSPSCCALMVIRPTWSSRACKPRARPRHGI